MFIYFLVLVTTSVVYGDRIIGGTDANIEDFPYQVSMEVDGKHKCGGSIITPTKILTAAHCTFGRAVSRLRIRAGSTWREQEGQVMSVTKKIEHPDYTTESISPDITLLILSEPLVLNNKVKTINVAQAEDVPLGTKANVTGWGLTEANVLAKRLLWVSIPRANNENCIKILPSVYNSTTMICYGGEVGKDSCSSDSGGPLVINGAQFGVVSYGISPCGSKAPGVYVKLHFLRDFIANSN